MAAESELNPTSYIQHHLTFLTKPVGEAGGFWSVNWDTIITTVIIGVLTFGFLWLVTRKATAGVPSKTQAFVELTIDFVNEQVKGIYHGESKVDRAARAHDVRARAVPQRDGLPARRHHVEVLRARVRPAHVARRARRPTSTRRSRWRCRCSR